MRRDSGYSDDDIVMTSGDDTEKLMTSDLTSSDDEARTLKRPGGCSLHWGWVVVASGFYCVAIVGGVSNDNDDSDDNDDNDHVIRSDTSLESSWTASRRSWRETLPSYRWLGVFRYDAM